MFLFNNKEKRQKRKEEKQRKKLQKEVKRDSEKFNKNPEKDYTEIFKDTGLADYNESFEKSTVNKDTKEDYVNELKDLEYQEIEENLNKELENEYLDLDDLDENNDEDFKSEYWDDEETEEENILIQEDKSKETVFVSEQDYTDIGGLSEIIERHKNNLSTERLLQRLNVSEDAKTRLEEKQFEYAKKSIFSSNIQNVTQAFENDLDALVENTRLNLRDYHSKSITKDYEGDALDLLESELEYMEEELEKKIEDRINKENEKLIEKVLNVEKKHEKEIEILKNKQEQEILDLTNEGNKLKENSISLFKTEAKGELKREKEKLVSETIYLQEQKEVNNLNEDKQKILKKFEEELVRASNKLSKNLELKLNELRAEMTGKEHEWKMEISKEELIQDNDKKHKLEERKLELEMEKIKREAEEVEKTRQLEREKWEQERIEAQEEREQLQKMFYAKMFGTLESNSNETMQTTQATQNKNMKLDKKHKKRDVLVGVLLTGAIISFIASMLLGDVINPPVRAEPQINGHSKQSSEEITLLKEEIDRLSDELYSLKTDESQGKEDIEKDSIETIETLTNQGRYEDAYKIAKTDDDLDIISNAMREKNDLLELISFNQKHVTDFGKLDELLLLEDTDNLHTYLENQDNEEEYYRGLSKDRQSEVIKLFNNNGYETKAKELIALALAEQG